MGLSMIEPVALADFFMSFFTAALMILTAVVYVSLYAWAEVKHKPLVKYASWFVYAMLIGCVLLFSRIMHLHGYWQILSVLMALGYWWMPRLILRLCVATHEEKGVK